MKYPNSTGAATCEKIGTEMINGRSAEKWDFVQTMRGQSVTAQVWFDARWHFIVRQETLGMTGELRNLKEGPQPPDLFEIPADYHKMTMQDRFRNNSPQYQKDPHECWAIEVPTAAPLSYGVRRAKSTPTGRRPVGVASRSAHFTKSSLRDFAVSGST
jgi:hypothetical protein